MAKVYIILLNWNGWKDTIRCLESVFRSDYDDFRVIVCDNNSSDGSMDYIKQWAEGAVEAGVWDQNNHGVHRDLEKLFLPAVPKPLAFIEPDGENSEDSENGEARLVLIQTGSNKGFSAGNNAGVRFALKHNPTYIWLLNNDTLIERETLPRLVAFMASHASVGLAGASIFRADAPDMPQTIGGGKLLPVLGTDYFLRKPGPVHYVSGTSLFIRDKVIRDIGLLDEGFFFYWEDTDYSARARKADWEVDTEVDAVVYHKHSASVGGRSLKSDLFKIASLSRYFKKHRPRTWWLPLGFNLLGMLVKRLARGQWGRIAPIIKESFKQPTI